MGRVFTAPNRRLSVYTTSRKPKSRYQAAARSQLKEAHSVTRALQEKARIEAAEAEARLQESLASERAASSVDVVKRRAQDPVGEQVQASGKDQPRKGIVPRLLPPEDDVGSPIDRAQEGGRRAQQRSRWRAAQMPPM